MWIKTFDDNLLNMKHMKSIKYINNGELCAYMDDGSSHKICSVKDHEDHIEKIMQIVQQISDEVIPM